MAYFKYLILLLLLVNTGANVRAQDITEPGSYDVSFEHGRRQRSFRVYVPESYARTDDPLPLVIAMHGASGSGAWMEELTQFSPLAEAHGFLVAYPDGVYGIWNDGRVGDERVPADLDDVGFISVMIDKIAQHLRVDANRVYASGYSMGGMMAFRLGCELPDKIAAVASVASTFPGYLLEACNPAAPVPVLVIQGTKDDVIPWQGIWRNNIPIYLSTAQTATYWGEHNGCADEPRLVEGLDLVVADGTLVRQVTYMDCLQDASVEIFAIIGGGHTWPGSRLSATFGKTGFDLYASPAIWRFFEPRRLNRDDA
ncbi:MAG: hypothetical protein HXY41_18005 [Chloroflexi bacterium]|nr:hypothetical protein [Chloroflexota bacterium]